jgi:glycosyltransferase involved in cell wall biosynthesis
MNYTLPQYSVLMSVYHKDNPDWVQISIESMLEQTVQPSEIVVLQDGLISEQLSALLSFYESQYHSLFKVFRFKENIGLGRALAIGVEKCQYAYIARMDADDYSMPERCQLELEYMKKHTDIEVVGSNVDEFIGNVDNVVAHVVLPEKHEQIYQYAKKRNPIRHPCLLFKKEAVLRCGNYRPMRFSQDYSIIVHLMLSGSKVYNIQKPLVFMRVANDFYKRRSGLNYFKINYRLNREFLNCRFFSPFDFFRRTLAQCVSCFMPNKIRELIYKQLLRSHS